MAWLVPLIGTVVSGAVAIFGSKHDSGAAYTPPPASPTSSASDLVSTLLPLALVGVLVVVVVKALK